MLASTYPVVRYTSCDKEGFTFLFTADRATEFRVNILMVVRGSITEVVEGDIILLLDTSTVCNIFYDIRYAYKIKLTAAFYYNTNEHYDNEFCRQRPFNNQLNPLYFKCVPKKLKTKV